MTPVEVLLSRLTKVKGRNGSWTACCPAHEDKGPSLAVREADDGRILLHCFAGCPTANVVGAIGMDMTDLFPPDEKRSEYPVEGKKRMKPAFYASDLIRILGFEALVVSICASDLRQGKALKDEDYERLKVAQQRIEEVMHYANI
jgi:hypothetical protein